MEDLVDLLPRWRGWRGWIEQEGLGDREREATRSDQPLIRCLLSRQVFGQLQVDWYPEGEAGLLGVFAMRELRIMQGINQFNSKEFQVRNATKLAPCGRTEP